jgi:hypothetical protein
MAAPKGEKALRKRQAERAELKSQDIIWIGIAASETNLQRIAAFLMFADMPTAVEPKQSLLPWEDPADPRFEKPPEIELNVELIKADIVFEMQRIVKATGGDKAAIKRLIEKYGGATLVTVPNNQLIALWRDLQEIE